MTSSTGGLFDLAVDTSSLYWTDTNNLMKVPLAGGAPAVLAANDHALSLTLDGSNVYWIGATSILAGDATIRKESLAGGAAVTLASGLRQPNFGIVVDATSVYWTDYQEGTVNKVPLAGGPVTMLASGADFPEKIAVDQTSVYWNSGASILKAPLDGGNPVTLATAGGNLGPLIAVDATTLYWAEGGSGQGQGGRIMKVSLDGGAPVELASRLSNPSDIAVDSTNVYWTTDTTVMKVPIGGGAPVTLATEQFRASAITVDPTNVYWTSLIQGEGAGVVRKAAKN